MNYNNQKIIDRYNKGEQLKYLFFWGHQVSPDGSITKSCFSQWWLQSFEVDKIVYKTAEHWMMAEKARLFNDQEIWETIIHAKSPAEAKKLGRMVPNFDAVIWDQHKYEIVVKGNQYKFEQDPELRSFLINTKNRILVEASPRDRIWGIGMGNNHSDINNPEKWRGSNLLGYALMEVRDLITDN